MSKSVTLSVRLSEEDANFIAVLDIADAITPSDKLRAIIKETRIRAGQIESYDQQLRAAREVLRPVIQRVNAAEIESHDHSELIGFFVDWLAEAFAFTKASPSIIRGDEFDPRAYELGLAKRIFRLIEWTARAGVTKDAPCYDKTLVSRKMSELGELISLLDQRLSKKG